MSDKLKPCPFCGGEAHIQTHEFVGCANTYGVVCLGCGVETRQFYESKSEVIKMWNTRVRPQGEWLKFGLGRGTRILFCTNCERRIEVPLSQGDSNYNFCPNCGADMRGEKDD